MDVIVELEFVSARSPAARDRQAYRRSKRQQHLAERRVLNGALRKARDSRKMLTEHA